MSNSIICESHLKKFIKQKAESLRPGWECKYVSREAIEKLEAKFRSIVISSIKQHPSIGKTFKQVIFLK